MQIIKKQKLQLEFRTSEEKPRQGEAKRAHEKKKKIRCTPQTEGKNVFPAARIICILPKTKLN